MATAQSSDPPSTTSQDTTLADEAGQLDAKPTADIIAPLMNDSVGHRRHNHARVQSMFGDATSQSRTNRFSLQFPIQMPKTPLTTIAATQETAEPLEDSAILERATTTPPEDFLTAVAAQERKVLELREELAKAEAYLDKLKAQWMEDEARKKREAARRMRQLRPISTSGGSITKTDSNMDSVMRSQQEVERRKAILSASKSSNRTVFSGSRHTRALSLLTPKDGVLPSPTALSITKPATTQVAEPIQEEAVSPVKSTKVLPRASTMPSVTIEDIGLSLDLSKFTENVDSEKLMRTGKKMATDLKDGLWGIWEDLRQATVGEEATQIPPPRKKPSSQTLRGARRQTSRNSLRPSSRESSVGSKASAETKRASPVRKANASGLPDLADPAFFHVDKSPTIIAQTKRTPSNIQLSATMNGMLIDTAEETSHAETEAWETWDDSPKPSRASSAFSDTGTIASTIPSSPNSRGSHDMQRKEPIPWPALQSLTPSQLKRTASTLMKEWERSLTPSPGQEWGGDYMNAGTQGTARKLEHND